MFTKQHHMQVWKLVDLRMYKCDHNMFKRPGLTLIMMDKKEDILSQYTKFSLEHDIPIILEFLISYIDVYASTYLESLV